MPNIEELKMQLLRAQAMLSTAQKIIDSVATPGSGAPKPVQAVCACCLSPIFSDDVEFHGGAHYHTECYATVNRLFDKK